MRTTQAALAEFEASWQVRFSRGSQFNRGDLRRTADAKSDLQEKQVVLLTDDNPDLEQSLEQQLRELTLLPLNIKYLSVSTFQKEGAPKEVTLIVTPYATALPLFSPPLFHAEETFSDHQQQQICKCWRPKPPLWPHHQRR